jgi:hypothetical protein
MVYVECYPDELLARTLGVQRCNLKHERGKGNILNRLDQVGAGMGLVDEDPGATPPNRFNKYRPVDQKGGIRLLEHVENPARKLVCLSPRLEEWLYTRAADLGLDPAKFGLPLKAQELHAIPRYDTRPGFRTFLEQLKHDPEVQCLEKWIAQG